MKEKFIQKLENLESSDQRILKVLIATSLVTLLLGLIYALFVVLGRSGLISLPGILGYQLLTLHGTTIFYYWLYFMQAAILIALILIYTEGVKGISWRSVAWVGVILMIVGFILNQITPILGAAVLYDAPAPLSNDYAGAGYFYLGYVLLAIGLLCITISVLWTAIRAKWQGHVQTWNTITFATVILSALLLVSGLAALNVFVPAMLGAFGVQNISSSYDMAYHVLFHNLHYLPLLSTVLVWYVLIEVLTGVKSIFSNFFSKIIFSIYLIVVPPTSLYHMFLNPQLPDEVKTAGSLLSLFINIPTILVFLLIVASLEASARASGAKGIFGWLKMLPWKNAAFVCIAMAVINAAAGGALASVLIQGALAPLLSDTFFVPAYFHFFTAGTVTLTFIGLLIYLVPILFKSTLSSSPKTRIMPYVLTVGTYLFGISGIVAGLMGVPRRTFGIEYGGAAPDMWPILMTLVGIGGILMFLALADMVGTLISSMMSKRKRGIAIGELPVIQLSGEGAKGQQAWIGPLCFILLLAAMFGLTAMAFEWMHALPVTGG